MSSKSKPRGLTKSALLGLATVAVLAGGVSPAAAAATWRTDPLRDVAYSGAIARYASDDIASVYADKSPDRLYVGLKDRSLDANLASRAVIVSKISLSGTNRRYQVGRTPSGSLTMLLYSTSTHSYTRVSCSGLRFASTSYTGTHGFSFPRSCIRAASGHPFHGTIYVGAEQQRKAGYDGRAFDNANYLLSYAI